MTATLPSVLVCDDDSLFHLATKQALKGRYTTHSAYNGDEALLLLQKHKIDVILLDISLRTPNEGIDYLPRILEVDSEVPVIMSSGDTRFDTVKLALQRGAFDYISKDFDPDALDHAIEQALSQKALKLRTEQQNFEALSFQKRHPLIGESRTMKELKNLLEKVKLSKANVLIFGETGTGKESVARHLRKTHPDGSLEAFVAVDSSTIQSTTAESQLFGHVKGAFTGADKLNKGLFEEADGGMIYFDEVANMPIDIQSKLLRVIQEKEVLRLGSTRPLTLDFRVVCASNQNLDELVKNGHFKHDLLQRIQVIPIVIPPLRDRLDDLPLLLEHFFNKHQVRLKFSDPAWENLQNYSWPGNVRELENLVIYLGTLCATEDVETSDLPPKIRDAYSDKQRNQESQEESDSSGSRSFYAQVSAFEKELIARELEIKNGNISQVAQSLQMDRSHLYKKLKDFGLHPSQKN